MQNILFEWEKASRILCGKYLFLFLDYDGTLSPIAERPDKAVLPAGTKDKLVKLSRLKNLKLAVISGRSLQDIKERVDIPGIIYSGNHGLEIEGPGLKFKNPVYARIESVLNSLKVLLKNSLRSIEGVLMEDKGLALSIHYRLVDRKQVALVKDTVHEAVNPYVLKKQLKLAFGKEVIEVRPAVGWNKGKVVLWLFARQKFAVSDKDSLPVYVGDDLTDESAFKALKDKGITIVVGKPEQTAAEYSLNDTYEVGEFLARILNIFKEEGSDGYGK